MSRACDCENCERAPYCDGPQYECRPIYNEEHYREPEYHGEDE